MNDRAPDPPPTTGGEPAGPDPAPADSVCALTESAARSDGQFEDDATLCRIAGPTLLKLTEEQRDHIRDQLAKWREAGYRPYGDLTNLLRESEEKRVLWGSWESLVAQGRVAIEPLRTMRPTEVWFVGDVHGDLLGLEVVLQFIKGQRTGKTPDVAPHVVFLGDLIDDGPESARVLARVFRRWQKHPDHTTLIVGNHEDALRFDDGIGRFVSDVSPSTLADDLNNECEESVKGFVRAAVDCLRRCPVALFLGDGTFAAHGGVPHADLLGQIRERSDLARPDCVQDFVWTRLHARARRRQPNRTTRSCELGVENFDEFVRRASDVLEQPVRRMIRGHDHHRARYDIPSAYGGRVVTINSMSARLPREIEPGFGRAPCVIRWTPDSLDLYRIEIDEAFIDEHSRLPRDGSDGP